MKKYINFMVVLVLLCSVTGCGENKTESSVINADLSESSVYVQTTVDEKTVEQTEENTEEERYVNLCGLRIDIPENFEKVKNAEYLDTFRESVADDEVYFCFLSDEMYGLFDENPVEYTYKNAPEIFEFSEKYIVRDFFNYPQKREVFEEIDTECNGFSFLKQKGSFEVKLDDDSIHEVFFIGYYGCMDIESLDNKNVPMMWIAFSETEKDSTKAEIENIIDNCTKKAMFIKE